jgi:predicted RNase H-like nuclease
LAGPALSIAVAEREVPGSPGLYAVHAGLEVWPLLGLGQAPDDRPLYAGKAERSLTSRDVRTHFATGKTGSSTLRRSLAGLLADELDLHGQPRNLANPESFANFGLEESGDARLTEWMHQHLRIAVWPSPDDVVLDEIETAVLERLLPPLNLDKVSTPWRPLVRAGRKRLADQAREWARPGVVSPRLAEEDATPSAGSASSRSGRVVGIDAAGKHGWVGVLVDRDGFQGAHLGSLTEVVAWAEPVDVIGIDIPIGHAEGGSRAADREARAFVGPRSSSVFPSPPADALTAGSYEEANLTLTGLGLPMLSRQAWALIPKITEAAEFADADDRAFEVHPEVSFCELAGQHLAWSKKSWNGLLLRRRLLAEAGIVLPDVIPEVAGVVADDVVDAAVVAWSAGRIAAGVARTLPDPPEQSDDRAVAIWC